MERRRNVRGRFGAPKAATISGLLLLVAALLILAAAPRRGEAAGARHSGHPFAACKRHGEHHGSLWLPKATSQPWQWQLQGKIDTSVPACVYDVDAFETSKKTVSKLHREHVKVICYVDVGSWEPYRPDKASSHAR